MLNRVFKILETVSEGGLDFRLADRRYPDELLEFPEQGQRLAVAHQLAVGVSVTAASSTAGNPASCGLLRVRQPKKMAATASTMAGNRKPRRQPKPGARNTCVATKVAKTVARKPPST